MNRIRLVAILSVAVFTCRAWAADPVTVESRITEVTLYPDRAQVTRTAEINIDPGEIRLVFDHLPFALANDSVRAAGKAPVQVVMEDVAVHTVVHEQIPDAKVQELADHVQDLYDQREALLSRNRVLDEQRKLIQAIEVKAAGDVTREIEVNKFDVSQLKDLPAFVGSEIARLEEESHKLAIEHRELDRKITAAEAEFNKYRTAGERSEKFAMVTLTSKEATKLRLQISYVIGNAGWAPAYEARAAADGSGVDLTYKAVVRQQTGEDWRGVNLTLSTAKPSIGAQMPDLNKWAVNILQPVAMAETATPLPPMAGPVESYRSLASDGMDKGMNRPERAAAPAEMLVVAQTAQVEQGVTAATFHVAGAADVPSDGEPHRQTIALASLPAAFTYETSPKLSPFAYLKASATNTTDTPFLAGAVNVFVGPDFIGTGRISTVSQGEAANLFLGIDEGIRVKREELKDSRGKSGLFRSRRRQVSSYKITVENYKDKPQRVVVLDQIPVSSADDVKVALSDASTKPATIDNATGKLTWELGLKPREKGEITFEFTVDWPQNREVTGL
ncbi:MAG TPA: mucoidy inhibitor MuiA family protein [Verrucomicrobiae bacterium]|nr:mucoidy inhibitor MuiA family protein [Verrucomicrobiae bacterium]